MNAETVQKFRQTAILIYSASGEVNYSGLFSLKRIILFIKIYFILFLPTTATPNSIRSSPARGPTCKYKELGTKETESAALQKR
jgi:hypothetical protein